MSKAYTMKLNGQSFVLFESRRDAISIPYSYRYKTFKEAYKRPSVEKQKEYEKWCKWFQEMGSEKYGIYTYNRYVFTMGGIIEIEGFKYYAYISRTRNELIPM